MPNDDVVAALRDYPKTVSLNATELVLRPADKDDLDAIVAFAKSLSEQDMLFLRIDITQRAAVKRWLSNINRGESVSILAQDPNGAVVGYATVDRTPARWTRRVGEIRVNVAAEYRSMGLGRQLTASIFDVARGLGLRKLVANMTPDQAGAQAAFARLGFHLEAVLADHIEDREGNVHDLNIMSYDIDGLTNQMDAALKL